jgi:hypothetical protein
MTVTQLTILGALLSSPLLFALFEYASDKLLAKLKYQGWQAIFLDSGQVYFGKISSINKTEIVLSDIYYLKADNGDIAGALKKSSSAEVSLIKLGDEIHAPKDSMTVSRAHVTLTEALKDTAQVVKAIDDYKLGERIGNVKLKDIF